MTVTRTTKTTPRAPGTAASVQRADARSAVPAGAAAAGLASTPRMTAQRASAEAAFGPALQLAGPEEEMPLQGAGLEEELPAQGKAVQRAGPEEEMPAQGKALQRAGMEEEEPMQGKAIQRAEEEELLQGKALQRAGVEEEEPLQGRAIQRAEEEEPLQGKALQRAGVDEEEPLQGKALRAAQREPKPNNTGLPDSLKSGIESLSGMSMDHVKVNYNSGKPADLNAHAYAQGSDIHVASGQEKHLPHEAWHTVQQAQGRVKPTTQMAGAPVNDDAGLEREADVMGEKAMQAGAQRKSGDG